MIRAGVIGWPVSHSKSPLIHGHWLKTLGIEGRYDAVAIEPQELESGVETLKKEGFSGFNVTLPHKETIVAMCDIVEPVAEMIGAVNTVAMDGRGVMTGTNTDAFGFFENLREQAPSFETRGASVCVYGAGGAARAVLYALIEAGAARITIVNRTEDKALALASHFATLAARRGTALDVAAQADAGHGLIVNSTSLGMKGQPPLTLDLSAARADAVVYDLVYVPLLTPLLEQARARGLTVVTGDGMLLHQAREGFRRWFGVLPDVTEELRRILRQA